MANNSQKTFNQNTNVLIPPQDPIPGREVISWPTPVIDDTILYEYVNTENGNYEALEYGTYFDSVKHSSFRKSYPNHILVYQVPVDPNGYIVKRTWVNNRVDQDTYNYSITYDQGNISYPTYTRTYVYPRSSYNNSPPGVNGPLEPLSADPVDPAAYLVQEQMMNEVDPPELNSLYIKVVRVYETLPGASSLSEDFDTELDSLVYTDRNVVLSTDIFDPTSNLLTLEMHETPRSQYTKQRVTSYLQELPVTKVEYQTGTYNFPTLVYGISLSVIQLIVSATSNTSEVIWFPSMRAAPTVQALLKVTTSFYTSQPSSENLFVLPLANLIYRGISFQIAMSGVLCDAMNLTAAFSDDDRYGDLSETCTFPATSISATAYNALIGNYVTIGCQISRWRGNIWVKQVTEVLLI